MNDCIFCKIIKHESPSDIQFENDHVIAFTSISKAAETHILVVPKKHIEKFTDIATEDSQSIMEMVKVAQELVKSKNINEGYKLIFNGGKYQKVPHLHLHILGGKLENEDKPESKI